MSVFFLLLGLYLLFGLWYSDLVSLSRLKGKGRGRRGTDAPLTRTLGGSR